MFSFYKISTRGKKKLMKQGRCDTSLMKRRTFFFENIFFNNPQIQLNGRGMVDVLLNGEILELEQEGITEFRGVSILKYANVSKYSVIFNSGISVTIKGTPDLLQMILLVPQRFKGIRDIIKLFIFLGAGQDLQRVDTGRPSLNAVYSLLIGFPDSPNLCLLVT
jgi:hypothetical protein